jgi:hypothetical protein
MPCARCGIRQTDPARGASLWRRVVAGGEQVIVCPICQRGPDWDAWSAGLDRCAGCGSARLAKALGVLRCGDCGRQSEAAAAPAVGVDASARAVAPAGGLAAEVEAALARVLGRQAGSANPRPAPDPPEGQRRSA